MGGVSPDRLDDLVKGAAIDPSCGGNPIALNEDNLRALFLDVI